MIFSDRVDAGLQLAERMLHLAGSDAIVLGLPRGGVPVGYEVATALELPLDVIVVRKLGVPWHEELAMGAIGDGVRVLDDDTVASLQVSTDDVDAVEQREQVELARRARRFRGQRGPLQLAGRTAIIVDDGVATGATARAACQVARSAGASRIILAVPVAPPDWNPPPVPAVDEFIWVARPSPFFAIGQWYADFTQTTDATVLDLLARSAERFRP
ncbi:phosphoribosyltransferase [Rathayibacter soli]|uniref:phosphoribosyltransferase n=1 Tax=Rathayibacter soli TaxID=3144168 RepID=UPI0027E42FE5|nr:phosphoribosyltransferase family protein [Glaciibacter superstes]